MVKENNKIVKEIVDKVKVRLKNMAGCYLAEHGVCGITEKARLYAEDKKKMLKAFDIDEKYIDEEIQSLC